MPSITIERDDDITTIGLYGPTGRVPLSSTVVADLASALDVIECDTEVRSVVFSGADHVFSTGADLAEIAGNDAARNARYNRSLIEVINRIDQLSVPTLAAINGHALGGGLELALACDLRIAADTAVLGVPETRLGLIPGAGGTQRLPRLIGEARAKDLLLTGRTIDAAEALRQGLVSQVVPRDALTDRARRLAATLARNAPLAVRLVKSEVRAGRERELFEAIDATHEALEVLLCSQDLAEGLAAFSEKRTPTFGGC